MPDTSFTVCRDGRDVAEVVAERAESADVSPFDVAIFDLQIGTMGGMATTMSLRLDESAGVIPHVPVLMLLDREADIHLARRMRRRRLVGQAARCAAPAQGGARAVAGGEAYHNGVRPRAWRRRSRRRRYAGRIDDAVGGEATPDSAEEEPAAAG